MYSFDICSFSYGVISHQTWGRVFSIGIFSLSSLLWGVIGSLEPFGLFHLTGYLHMNIKTRQSPLFLPYVVVSDILAFSTEHFLFVLGLSSLYLVGGRGCGRGSPCGPGLIMCHKLCAILQIQLFLVLLLYSRAPAFHKHDLKIT